MNSLAAISTNQLTTIVIYMVVLVVAWLVLRIVLRIAHRIFVFGCGAILFLGLLLVLMRFLNHS
jgi:hypothetical protein